MIDAIITATGYPQETVFSAIIGIVVILCPFAVIR